MWKKFLLAIVSFAGMLSIAFACFNFNMKAASSLSWFQYDNLNEGSKLVMGKTVWDVAVEYNGNYTIMTTDLIGQQQICSNDTDNVLIPNGTLVAWCQFISTNPNKDNAGHYYVIKNFNDNNFSVFEQNVIIDNSTFSEGGFRYAFIPRGSDFPNYLGIPYSDIFNKVTFQSGLYLLADYGIYLTSVDRQMSVSSDTTSEVAVNTRYPYSTSPYIKGFRIRGVRGGPTGSFFTMGEVRAFSRIPKDSIVFALPSSYTGNMQEIVINHTVANDRSTANSLRVRYEDSNNGIVTFDSFKNQEGEDITRAEIGDTVNIKYTATAKGAGQMISAIFHNKDTNKSYYKQLESNGNGSVDLSTANFDPGSYEFVLVNETDTQVTEGESMRLAPCSPLSNVKTIDLVVPHKIAYNKQPESGASSGKDYEYSKNVNGGQKVGYITVSPQGVMPLVYTIETNGGDTTYLNFEIDGLDSNNASSSTILNVKIKTSAPDLGDGGLKAGTYQFCISTKDDNGYPQTPNTSNQSKVCTTLKVEKPILKIEFDEKSDIKKTAAEAAANWHETATVTPNNNDVKIKYSKVGGNVGLIDIDPDTGEITYKGNGAYGKVKIRATADDKDKDSGVDNYDEVYTEKEIIICQDLDGAITPHANSSDATVPTFTATDANVKSGGVIGTIKGTKGTPDNLSSGTITYTYGLKTDGDGSFFSVNTVTGEIKTTADLPVGAYHITVTVIDKWNTEPKEIPVTINVGVAKAEELKFYENSTSNTVITQKTVSFTDTNVSVFATVKGSSNANPITYKIKDGSTNVITINPNSGVVTIEGTGTVIIVAEKKGTSGQADAQAELTFTVTAGAQNFIYTDNAGNELPKAGDIYNAKTEVYESNKTFQLYTAGNLPGSTVSYQLKDGSPTDVISVDSSGLVTILNASLNNQMGKVIVQATSHDPSGNYSDKTIELPINIEKGTRVISFAENPIYVTNGKGKVTPVTEVDGVTDTDGDVLIEVDSNEDHTIAWTNDNKTIDYNYSGDTGKDIKIHATKPMDRNYKAAEADGMIHIMGPDENVLAITSPGQIIYGDHFTIKSTQYDADSTNVKYTFEIDDSTYISKPTVNGNIAEFDALKYSAGKKTTITVTRTADGETPLSKNVQVTVLPKPIEIIIDDKEKLKGEVNPTLTYQDFKNQLVSWNGVQDVIQENDIKLNTTANTNSNAGSYPIKGDANSLNKTYPNYSFTFKEGTLTIKEENIEDDWYHLEIDDGSNTLYTGNWTNQDVNIISDHLEYINLSLDQSTWKPNSVTVSKEGETNQSFWMKKDSGAITKEKQEIIRIDKTAPKVKGIKAKDTNNKLQDIINKLSGGIFFKPGTSFEITTDDSKDDLKVSGTKEIAYKVYKVDKTGEAADELIKDGSLTVTNEKASITISELTGTYKVCVIPTDNAGNTNAESCHEVELKKIDVDVDEDGKPDFNDPDGDGCPDLNIKWKDPNNESKWIVINGDRNNDGIPDLNIDSDGDGKPDLNIDTDHDGKPDLNLVILKKSDWKPTKCVKADIDKGILEDYCTGTSVKAVINVDTDGDGIPNINIDNKGDFKPRLNISKDGITATVNITDVHEWKPNKNYTSGKFTYDSIGEEYQPQINIDSDGDGRPDINIDIDGDGIPDLNIDTDGDNIPDINIDSKGDGLPDVNVDTDDDGNPDENIIEITEWKPNKNVDGDILYDTMDFSKPDEPNDSNIDQPDTSVMGQYNPQTSMGGANTGDETNIMLYLGTVCMGLGIIIYLLYRYQKDILQ